MKHSHTCFLQAVLVLLAIGVLAALLYEPWVEGVNANATGLYDIYFDDPLLAYVYLGSIPFFVAIYKAFTLLTYIGKEKVFSQPSVQALRAIKYCAIVIIIFIAGAEVFVFLDKSNSDDIAGGVAMGVMIAFASCVIATAAAVFEALLQSAVDMKTENELTI